MGRKNISFENGTTYYEPQGLHRWLNKFGVKYLMCDVGKFYTEMSNIWRLAHGIEGLKELILVLVPKTKQHSRAKGPVEILEPDFGWG